MTGAKPEAWRPQSGADLRVSRPRGLGRVRACGGGRRGCGVYPARSPRGGALGVSDLRAFHRDDSRTLGEGLRRPCPPCGPGTGRAAPFMLRLSFWRLGPVRIL